MNLRSTATIMAVIAATVPFLLLCLRASKINLKRSERGHQFILPVLAVIYCLPLMFYVDKVAVGIVRAVSALAVWASLIPGVGGTISSMLAGLYDTLKTGYGVQLLCNTMVMAAFCLLKRIALPIVRKRWSKWKWLYDATAGRFYENNSNKLHLKQEFAQMRQMFNAMYVAAVAIGCLDCVLAFVFSDSETFAFPFYPVFGIIVLGEISFFLNGWTVDEASQGEEPEEEENEVDCAQLMEALRDKFGDRISMSDQVPKGTARTQEHNWELELEESDQLDQIAGAYFSAMQQDEGWVNPDYVNAARKLLHRKSVLIHNPFYHDMTAYLLLPVFHELLNHRSCLVVCGRMTNERDIQQWLHEGIETVTNLPKLWKIRELDQTTVGGETPDIGILGFRKLYDLENLRMNRDFFEKVGMVILLEPSNLLGTGQIGLRSVLQYCEGDEKELTYCILDRNADGSVDALSHAIRQSITEVVASPVPESRYCRMFWKAEGPGMQTRILPRTSHYFGIGGEMAILAMHEGAGNIHWYSGSKMPLADLRWNVEQYYAPICQYTHLPREQSELDERFQFHENLWQAGTERDAFVIVEDEFCNAFEMSRTFAARIRNKGFINVLSESYLLRDYMCANYELFSNDPKAIPSIVPDFARTERNFVLRTLMLMATDPVDERTLSRELSLHGYDVRDPYQKLCALITKHIGIENPQIQTIREQVNSIGGKCSRFAYRVDHKLVESVFDSALKSAHYVVENEQTDTYPMGNRLMGHIEQVMLPGQFFSYDGKYYQVRTISADNGIIVRRAADHLNGRCYYRQLRDYEVRINEWMDNARDLRGMKLQNCFADHQVTTDGYLEMKCRNLLPQATVVRLENVHTRRITHKDTLVVRMSDASPAVRFTLCVLFNELFQTIYPNEAGYLVAACGGLGEDVLGDKDYSERIRALVPAIQTSENGCIFFIEDSSIDLGLLVSLERNFQRLMEILADYLDWYLDPTRPRDGKEIKGAPQPEPPTEKPGEESNEEEASSESDAPDGDSAVSEDAAEANAVMADAVVGASAEDSADVDGEDEELLGEGGRDSVDQGRLQPMEYLTYGYGDEPGWLALEETLKFLVEHQFNDSNLQRSRKKVPSFDDGSHYDPDQPGTHYCDFCGKVLEKGKYDVLKDGRERCSECGKDAIKTRRQFKKVYAETLDEMERIFGIQMGGPVKVRMANAKKVNDDADMEYKPSPRFDPRVLGFAQGNKILVENGAPKWKMKSTLVHELTHIWQGRNWDQAYLSRYGKDESVKMVMEGMAVWVEVQYLLSMGEKERAIMYKRNRDADPSAYGVGMKKFLAKYPPKESETIDTKKSPFGKFPPL